METKFNFKSQVCTSRVQSERLLSLGLKKETADMCYRYVNTVKGEKKYELIVEAAWSQEVIDEYVRFGTKIGLFNNLVHPCGKPVTPLEARADLTKNDIPAWSLHRLIEMMPENVTSDDWLGVSFDDVSYYHGEGEDMIGWKYYNAGNLYDCIIECYEWLINGGYFNKEYLV
jgi:hypothetical protein